MPPVLSTLNHAFHYCPRCENDIPATRTNWDAQRNMCAQCSRQRPLTIRLLWQEHGLVNGATGLLEDVVWAEGSERSDLPLAVLVSCPTYSGPTVWRTEPRPGFPEGVPVVPITAIKTTFEGKGRTLGRTQLPLRLAWAVNVHKSQGLTISRAKIGLGTSEFCSGLTFVALSRVKSLDTLMLVDKVDFSRVQKLGGKGLQQCTDDLRRRYLH